MWPLKSHLGERREGGGRRAFQKAGRGACWQRYLSEAGQGGVGQASREGRRGRGTEWGQMSGCQGLQGSSPEGRGLAQPPHGNPFPSGVQGVDRGWAQVLQAPLRVSSVSPWASHPPSLAWGGQQRMLRAAQPSGTRYKVKASMFPTSGAGQLVARGGTCRQGNGSSSQPETGLRIELSAP